MGKLSVADKTVGVALVLTVVGAIIGNFAAHSVGMINGSILGFMTGMIMTPLVYIFWDNYL